MKGEAELRAALRGRSIAVFGGTGLIGGEVVARALALETGAPVYAIARTAPASRVAGATYIAGSVLSPIAGLPKVDAAVFVVGPSSNFLEDAKGTIDIATTGVTRFLEQTSGARRVLVGSGRVYGRRIEEAPLDETAPCILASPDPANLYDAAKILAEALAQRASSEASPVMIVRLGNVFGGLERSRSTAFSGFVGAALAREPVVVRDPASLRNYADSRDVAEGLLRALAFGRAGETYNLGSRCHLTNRAFTEKILRAVSSFSGFSGVSSISSPEKPPAPAHMVLSIEKAARELGFEPKHDIDEAVVRAVRHQLEAMDHRTEGEPPAAFPNAHLEQRP